MATERSQEAEVNGGLDRDVSAPTLDDTTTTTGTGTTSIDREALVAANNITGATSNHVEEEMLTEKREEDQEEEETESNSSTAAPSTTAETEVASRARGEGGVGGDDANDASAAAGSFPSTAVPTAATPLDLDFLRRALPNVEYEPGDSAEVKYNQWLQTIHSQEIYSLEGWMRVAMDSWLNLAIYQLLPLGVSAGISRQIAIDRGEQPEWLQTQRGNDDPITFSFVEEAMLPETRPDHVINEWFESLLREEISTVGILEFVLFSHYATHIRLPLGVLAAFRLKCHQVVFGASPPWPSSSPSPSSFPAAQPTGMSDTRRGGRGGGRGGSTNTNTNSVNQQGPFLRVGVYPVGRGGRGLAGR